MTPVVVGSADHQVLQVPVRLGAFAHLVHLGAAKLSHALSIDTKGGTGALVKVRLEAAVELEEGGPALRTCEKYSEICIMYGYGHRTSPGHSQRGRSGSLPKTNGTTTTG